MVKLRFNQPTVGVDPIEGAMIMDKMIVELLARPAGLKKALAQFPEDVAAAAKHRLAPGAP